MVLVSDRQVHQLDKEKSEEIEHLWELLVSTNWHFKSVKKNNPLNNWGWETILVSALTALSKFQVNQRFKSNSKILKVQETLPFLKDCFLWEGYNSEKTCRSNMRWVGEIRPHPNWNVLFLNFIKWKDRNTEQNYFIFCNKYLIF